MDQSSPSPNPPAASQPAPAAPAAAAPAAPAPITIDQFAALDLRVATVVAAEFHSNADKLLKLRLDDGTPEGRQVCAGIRAWYDPASLVGKQVVIVANLAPRTIRGEISQGMVLCANDPKDEGGVERDVVILTPQRSVKSGAQIR